MTLPKRVGTAAWTTLDAGASHACAIESDATLWCWGSNSVGQLGDGTTTERRSPTQVGSATWTSLSAGSGHSCAINSDATLWCWGSNLGGQLGDGTTTERHSPRLVGSATWTAVSVGWVHSCAIRSDATLWCWGGNADGQLGLGTTTNKSVPAQVGSATWIALSAGSTHTCAIRSDGTLWCWGDNGNGPLGDGTTTASHGPAQVGSATWIAVSAGGGQTCAIESDATLWCWGNNSSGQLGDGTTTDRYIPTQVGSAGWTAVSGGTRYTCAIRSDATLWCWGANEFGQLGDGTSTSRTSPTPVILDTTAPTSRVTGLDASQSSPSFAVAWTGSDDASGIASYDIGVRDDGTAGNAGGWTLWRTGTNALDDTFDGAIGHRYCFRSRATDNAGNVEAWPADADTCTRVADTHAPTGASVTIPGGAFTDTADVTLALVATDDSGVVTEMRVSEASDLSGATWQPYATSLPFTLSGPDGPKTVYARFRDAEGNVSDTASDDIILERVEPSSAVAALAATQSAASFTVSWSGSDPDPASGIATYDVQVRDDGPTPPGGTGTPGDWTPWQPATTATSATFDGTQGHRTCFRSRAHDHAGNTEAWPADPDTCTRVADTTAPGGVSIVIDGGHDFADTGSVTLTLSASDNLAVTEMKVSEDAGFSGVDWQPYATSLPWTLSPGDGDKTVHVRFRDADGNVSDTVSDTIALDTVSPDGTIAINRGQDHEAFSTTVRAVHVLLAGTDDRSGIGSYRLSTDGGDSWTGWTDGGEGTLVDVTLPAGPDGTRTVHAQFRDHAGNLSLPASDAIDLDSSVDSVDFGLSVDHGAVFTNTASVVLDIAARPGTTEMRVSNDGGFAGADWEPYATHRAWTINTFGNQVFTAVVYVRYRDAHGDPVGGTSQDDIILDPNPPTPTGGAALANGRDMLVTPTPAPDPSPAPGASPATGPAAAPDPAAVPTLAKTVKLNTAATDDRSGVVAMQVSNDAKFTGALWEPYAATRAWPVDTGAATTVWIRFRDGAGNISPAVKHRLTATTAPTVVTQVAPVHLQTQTSRRPTFRWFALAGATRYQLQVATATAFAPGTVLLSTNSTTTSSVPASPLPADKTLYWRVRRSGGAWSPTWRFKTPLADGPALIGPADKDVVGSLSPTLSWGAIAGATGYQLQLGVERTFSAGVRTFGPSGTSVDLPPLAAASGYVWQVRARLGSAWGAWSAVRSFTTPVLGRVALRSPADGATPPAGPVTLDWLDVTGADHYDVQVCSDDACSGVERSPEPDNSIVVIGGLSNGSHWWRVRAVGPDGQQGAWSTTRRFLR